jgi:hypothetical protein
MLISPDEVKAKAKSKENENYAFRTYLKMHADPLKLDEQFRKLHDGQIFIVDSAEGKRYYIGSLWISDDLEIIEL